MIKTCDVQSWSTCEIHRERAVCSSSPLDNQLRPAIQATSIRGYHAQRRIPSTRRWKEICTLTLIIGHNRQGSCLTEVDTIFPNPPILTAHFDGSRQRSREGRVPGYVGEEINGGGVDEK